MAIKVTIHIDEAGLERLRRKVARAHAALERFRRELEELARRGGDLDDDDTQLECWAQTDTVLDGS